MSTSVVVMAPALYWAIYGIALAVAVPVGIALLFGMFQTVKWLLRGGKTKGPDPHQRIRDV